MSGSTRCNKGFRQVEPILTVAQLKKRYMFGIDVKDKDGKVLPDSVCQAHINNAVSALEHLLDISITPRTTTEEKDYNANDYIQWGYLQLNNFPLISISEMNIVYLHDLNNDPETSLEIPLNWVRLDKETGIVRLIPNNKFPSRLAVDSGASFFPELFRRQGHVPNLWRVTYKYGFDDGKVPVLLNHAIGLMSSLFVLSVAGNLVLGAGIAATSISLDGLSQSISTTQSAENSAYSATRKEYLDALLGRNKDEPGVVQMLMDYYKGQQINII